MNHAPASPSPPFRWPKATLLAFLATFLIAAAGRLLEDSLQSISGVDPANPYGLMDSSSPAAIAGMVSLLACTGLVLSALRLCLVGFFFRAKLGMGAKPSAPQTLNLMLIESIRSLAAVIIRLPLLLLPAIYEWIRLSIVPYIVLLDRSYRDGGVDALQRARELFRRHWGWVSLLLLPPAFVWAIELVLASLAESDSTLFTAPLLTLAQIAGIAVLQLTADVLLLTLARRKLFFG